MTPPLTPGEQIAAAIAAAGLTQRPLAAAAGLTQARVNDVAHGADCYLSTMQALVNAIGVPVTIYPGAPYPEASARTRARRAAKAGEPQR